MEIIFNLPDVKSKPSRYLKYFMSDLRGMNIFNMVYVPLWCNTYLICFLPKVATGHMLYGNTKRNQASGQLI
jgi:hypothetical protein